MRFKRLSIICFLLVCSCSLQAEGLLDKANTSSDFLAKNVIHTQPQDFSEEQAVNAIVDVSMALNHLSLDTKSHLDLRKIRALAAFKINQKRESENRSLDKKLAKLAIEDISIVLDERESAEDAPLGYVAGDMALHFLRDNQLAFEYWQQCAQWGHIACMNKMALENWLGEYGMALDVKKSMLWHAQIANAGAVNSCESVFSANLLSLMSYFFPELKITGDWQQWRAKRDKLLQALTTNGQEALACGTDSFYVNDFMLNNLEGNIAKAPLELAINAATNASKNKPIIEAITALKDDLSFADTAAKIKVLDEARTRCSLTFSLLVMGKFNQEGGREKKAQVNNLEDRLYSIEPAACVYESGIVNRLREQGRWAEE